jgi:hypothetical protein
VLHRRSPSLNALSGFTGFIGQNTEPQVSDLDLYQ